jgi:hypothetical protein
MWRRHKGPLGKAEVAAPPGEVGSEMDPLTHILVWLAEGLVKGEPAAWPSCGPRGCP